MSGQPIGGSLLVAHASSLVREGLVDALTDAGVLDVRRAGNREDAVTALATRPAQVVVCDSELGDRDVARLVIDLQDSGAAAVVILAPHVEESSLLAALEAGALGYLSRDSSLDRLVYDIQGALRGEACLPRDKLAPILRLLIDRRREEDERSARLLRLSKREAEVLEHLGTGATNEQIASSLFLSQATVRTHVQNILTKLEVHSRLEAIALLNHRSATGRIQPR